ncbi:hypothetical protein dsx2_0179 [Desulfovibrio sp. X2]|uniref:hypothetical protein n=1 Tax=Desulfovibrio sp. X2 TaxID=941449 RepID=UPI000358AEFC|nr:hypothetical protein [Desulfovibrio sp. X2]EPR42252.1 hypothetical protein dsx2_0179 [Desulfovibrio sp. X2]
MLLTAVSLTKIVASLDFRLEILFSLAGELLRRGHEAAGREVLDSAQRLLLFAESQRSRIVDSLGGWALKKPTGQISAGWVNLDLSEELARMRDSKRFAEFHARYCGASPGRTLQTPSSGSPFDGAALSAELEQALHARGATGLRLGRAAEVASSCALSACAHGDFALCLRALVALLGVFDEMTWEREDDPHLSESVGLCLAEYVIAASVAEGTPPAP